LCEESSAGQREEHDDAQIRKARAGEQIFARRKGGAIFRRIRQAAATGIDDPNGTALEQDFVGNRGGGFGAVKALPENIMKQVIGELASRLAVSGCAFIDAAGLVQGKESLDLAHDLATGSVGLKDLPEPAPDGARQGKYALSGMIFFGILAQQRQGDRGGEAHFDLGQSQLGETAHEADGVLAEVGELGAPGRKERGGITHGGGIYTALLTPRLSSSA
jgi:hypothetical protein